MFRIRTEARILSHGIKLKASALRLLCAFALAGAAVSLLLLLLCVCYGAPAVFAGYAFVSSPGMCRALPWLLAAAFLLYTLFFCALRAALSAVFFSRADPAGARPARFFTLAAGVRELCCALQIFLRGAGWALLFGSPAAVTAVCLSVLLRGEGLPAAALYAGAGLCAAQFLAAGAASFLLCGRYSMTRYLLYLNPLLGVKEAVRSGVLLTRGRLLRVAACRLSLLPWQLLRLFAPARPFAFAYTRLAGAVLCRRMYKDADW